MVKRKTAISAIWAALAALFIWGHAVAATLDGAPPPFGSSASELRSDDALEKAELYARARRPATATGTGNAIILTSSSVAATSYRDKMEVVFVAGANNTTATTVNLDGLGVVGLVHSDNSALVSGDLAAGSFYTITYIASSNNFRLAIATNAASPVLNTIHSNTYLGTSDFGALLNATSITSGLKALTVTGASFASGDVGKTIVVDGAGAAGAPLLTTISAFTSSTQVTLTAAASTTLSAATKAVWYGTDKTTAMQSFITACQATVAPCYYDGGYFAVTNAINITAPIKLAGSGGQNGGIFQLDPTKTLFAVNTNSQVHITDMGLWCLPGSTTVGASGSGINITATTGQNTGSEIARNYINGCRFGISTGSANLLHITDNNIYNDYIGLYLQDQNSLFSGGYFVSHNQIACNTATPSVAFAAVMIVSGGNLQLSNNMLHYCQYGLYAQTSGTTWIGDIYASNNSIEQNSYACMLFDSSSNVAANVNSVSISGGDCAGGTPNGIVLGSSETANYYDFSISGVNIDPCSAAGPTCVAVGAGAAYGIIIRGGARGVSVMGNTFANGGGSASTGILVSVNATGVQGINSFRGLTTNETNGASGTFIVGAVP